MSSENNLRLANNKAQDLTIKRLTRKNPTMKAAFEALKAEQEEDASEIALSRGKIRRAHLQCDLRRSTSATPAELLDNMVPGVGVQPGQGGAGPSRPRPTPEIRSSC